MPSSFCLTREFRMRNAHPEERPGTLSDRAQTRPISDDLPTWLVRNFCPLSSAAPLSSTPLRSRRQLSNSAA